MEYNWNLTEKNWPLTPAERKRVIEAAKCGSKAAEVSVLTPLFSGMYAKYVAHIQAKMISETPDGLKITLTPGSHECLCSGRSGSTDWGRDNGSCGQCENGVFEFPNPRVIPIRDDRVVKPILEWFSLYDRLPSPSKVTSFIYATGKDADVPRLNPTCLRHSFGVLLAGKGFERPEIAELMGFSEEPASNCMCNITDYGRLCEGDNPFICGAETGSDVETNKCQQVVDRGSDRCWIHQDQCGAEKARGGSCRRGGSQLDGKCRYHTESE